MEHYTILVVEGDPLIRANASVLLAEAGFAVEVCESAAAAASLIDARKGEFGAVFTDVDAAGALDGLEFAVLLTTLWPKIMVLATSGRSVERPQALPLGVGFMPKPWLPLNVLVTMQRAAEAHRHGVAL